ncbi:MAG: hypothetical protein QGG42_06255 [Phycisphaerae bacterium]|nr:hypothetical protein [Phycisphaerae bacterium]
MLKATAIVFAAAALIGCRRPPTDASPNVLPASGPASMPASGPADNEDARMRKLVLGTWADEYQGKRTMTLRPDGTGTMLVELDGLKAFMFASRLRFDMVWSLENGRLKKRTVGGEPAGKVGLILATMGDRVDEPILELTDKRLLLLDANGKTKYDWRRVDGAVKAP